MIKISQIFDVIYGTNLELNKLTVVKSKGIPFVSRTEKNNGVTAFVENIEGVQPNPPMTISVALTGTVLEAFYQPEEYYSGRDICYLKPKTNLTLNEMLFYATCIRKNQFKYSYGRGANKTIRDLIVPDLNQIPANVKTYTMKTVGVKSSAPNLINLSNWNCIQLDKLFSIERGNCGTLGLICDDFGVNPIVSASEYNNGINNYTNEPTNYNKNTITVALNGSVGASFYQNGDYLATNDVAVLKPLFEEFNQNIGLILVTMISSVVKMKFSYGRKCTPTELRKLVIKLPFKEGRIDWNEIENISKQIQSKFSFK